MWIKFSWVETYGKAIYELRYRIASYIWEEWVMHLKCPADRNTGSSKKWNWKNCVKNCEKPETYLFHANELACQSFMDVCRTYKTSGSGATRFLILEIQYEWPDPVIAARAYIYTYTHKTYIHILDCVKSELDFSK